MFNLELLQAINDWQKAGFGSEKESLAENIRKYASHLPNKFKTLTNVCYRKINLKGKSIMDIGLYWEISEKYSSWTFQNSIAQNFDDGIPLQESGEIAYIFEWNPSESKGFEVIINLYELFNDSDFINACKENQNLVNDFHLGIGRFQNSEEEVVLKVSKLSIDQVWALGGYGEKNEEKFYKLIYKKTPTQQQLKQFNEMILQKNIPIRKPNWITKESNPEAIERLIKKNKEHASNLIKE